MNLYTSPLFPIVLQQLKAEEVAHADWFAQFDPDAVLAPHSGATSARLTEALETAPSEFLRGWCATLLAVDADLAAPEPMAA